MIQCQRKYLFIPSFGELLRTNIHSFINRINNCKMHKDKEHNEVMRVCRCFQISGQFGVYHPVLTLINIVL